MKNLSQTLGLRILFIVSGILILPALLAGDVLITEVADGDIDFDNPSNDPAGTAQQQPKFIEITNTGTSEYTFPDGSGIVIQSNPGSSGGSTNPFPDLIVDLELGGVTIGPGESYVIVSVTPGDGEVIDNATGKYIGQLAFEAIFGEGIADEYTTDVSFGNGDDPVVLFDGTDAIDTFGEFYVDATPDGLGGEIAPWAYVDSYATRNPQLTTAKGRDFDVAEWSYGGVDALAAGTLEEQIILAQSFLTPGSYDSGSGGNTWAGYDVDEFGNVDTMMWMGYLNIATGDWVWTYSLNKYIYLPENFVSGSGAWTYIPAN